jgi:hypothetical protein
MTLRIHKQQLLAILIRAVTTRPLRKYHEELRLHAITDTGGMDFQHFMS